MGKRIYVMIRYDNLYFRSVIDLHNKDKLLADYIIRINPSTAEANFVQSTRIQRFWKTSKPCHVGIHWIALAEYSQMSSHMPGFQS